jgi:hypothetical protein
MSRRLPMSVLLASLLALAACGSSSANPPPPGTVDAAVPPATADAGLPPPPPPGAGSRFTLVVIPDTQYLFDQDRGDADVLAASLDWIVAHRDEYGIVFTAALGDIVENHGDDEFIQAEATYKILDDHELPYSTPAGNHDLSRSSQYDDQRGAEAYLAHFSPARAATRPGFGGASDNGYNTWFTFDGGGQTWLLLALDWRASMGSIAWAQGVIDAHPTLPVILTTHELVYGDEGDDSGTAYLSEYGQYLWNNLVAQNDQIFLTLNGHFWPPARTVLKNAAGHDVHLHIANYQDRYYGGSGMIRLYQFDLARGTIDVSTFSPYWLAQPADTRNPLARAEVERNDAASRFVDHIDFAGRFRGFQGGVPPAPPGLPTRQAVIPGTLAYWRFEGGTPGEPLPATGVAVADLSGHGNDLERVTLAAGVAGDLVWSSDHHPAQPGHASLALHGSKANPAFGGAYLRTVASAPLNAQTFPDGYTIEAFVRLPADCCTDDHAWMGILSRMGTGGDAGKTGGDPDEPVATLTVPPGGGLQWAIFPSNAQDILTNWSHQIRGGGDWFHVAVVNDGHHSTMYVDGAPVLRNPRAESVGVTSHAEPWLLGATHYARIVEQSFYGSIGDVRIVDHALTPAQFMTAR